MCPTEMQKKKKKKKMSNRIGHIIKYNPWILRVFLDNSGNLSLAFVVLGKRPIQNEGHVIYTTSKSKE